MRTFLLEFKPALVLLTVAAVAAPDAFGASPVDLRQGLVAHWPLDESADGVSTPDLSPFANHLQLVNMDAANFVAGHRGNAAQFNGTDELLSRIYTPGPDVGLPVSPMRRFTVSLWVNGVGSTQGGTGAGDRRIFSEGSTAGNNQLFNLGTDSAAAATRTNVLDVFIRNDAGTAVVNHRKTAGTPFDGTWHHIAWVQDNNTVRVYLDGAPDATDFSYGASTLSLNTVSIGGIQRAATAAFFAGLIDDVAVWERPLSQAEVQEVMNNGLTTPIPEFPPLIVGEPAGATLRLGDNLQLAVAVAGNRPLSYQWLKDDVEILGANASSHLILGATAADAGSYSVRASNLEGAVTSAAALVVVQPDPPANLVEGLISYWPLDLVEDNGGTPISPDLYSQNNLELINLSLLDQVPGNTGLGEALRFNGVSQYARRTGGFPIYNSLTHSISFWVRGTGPSQLDLRVFSEGSSANNTPLFTFGTMPTPGGNGMRVFIRNDANATVLAQNTTRPVFDDAWHHVVWTDSNGTARVYVDGVLDPSSFRYTRSALTINVTSIGAILRAAAGSFFNGEIDEVAVWTRELSFTEVNQIFSGRVPPPVAVIPPEITRQPVGADVFEGADVVLSVEAIGTALNYQWRKNGEDVPDATNSVLILTATLPADAGTYTVRISNSANTIVSEPATVNVTPIVDATTGLVAYWPLDVVTEANLTPDTVSGNSLTLVNMDASNLVPGQRGQALSFNGIDELAFRNHTIDPSVGLPVYQHASFTVALWVSGVGNAQPATPVNGDRRVFSEASTVNANPLFNLGTDNGNASASGDVYIRNDAGAAPVEHRKTVNPAFDGAWHHLAYVEDITGGKVYVDGVLDSTAFNYSRTPLTPDTTSIGGIVRAAQSHWFLGTLDDVAVWRRALSATEIAYVKNSGAVPPPLLHVSAIAVSETSVTLTFTIPNPDTFYCIQQTADLTTPNWTDVTGVIFISAEGNTLQAQFPREGGAGMFYRVYHCP